MHIKWDVPKGFVHKFRDRLSVFFSGIKMYTFLNLQKGNILVKRDGYFAHT